MAALGGIMDKFSKGLMIYPVSIIIFIILASYGKHWFIKRDID